jgi:hypothetical protein
MQDVNIEFEVPTLPEIDVSLEIVTNGTFWGNIEGDITKQTDLQNALNDKQDVLTAGDNIQIEDNVISATDTTYTAGEGISIEDNVISNTQTSAEWGNIEGDIADQTDLTDLIDTKIDIEATARENNDLSLQNGINTLNDDLTAEISNRGTADGILQDNIDTLSGTVTSNYNTLDGKISDNKTAIDNHIADKNNPHDVTKSQVGLGNVDNTSDLNKPISTATQNALNTKVSNTREINGYALSSDITLTASDVGALPDTTTINDLTTAEQQSALNSGANTTNIGQIATNTQNISNEVTNRQNADNNLQSQIDALVVASDVFDIVGTYAELQAYDISTVPVNDIIKVLVDSTHNNAATYYRCVENDNVKSWSYIGAEGAYYTKSEADGRFVEQTTTVNGQALSNNITLDAEDVGALPDTTTIGNGTLTIQQNSTTIDTFGANDTGNTTVNITVPTDNLELTNGAGYITGINRTDVINALGYTPYNNTNPAGYTSNTGTITGIKMNNATVGTSGLVNLGDVMTIKGDIGDFTPVDSLSFGLYYLENVSNSQLPVTTNASGFLISYSWRGQVCLINNKMYYRQYARSLGRFGNWQVAITDSDLLLKQDKSNLVTSLSASSTDSQYPSAKCVYDLVGDIESALNTINSGVSS